ncbi:MAG TPA: DUF4349 domain-containing protein [Solirubrobacterales bacterium]|nr:DUF4349 domain-containing protein [Solirubrobacterales bacterium]
MEPFRDDNELIAELRALRPEPSQEFSAELDERAAAGFPRRSSRPDSPLTAPIARLRELSPRRLAFSGGAVALATIAIATVVVANGGSKSDPGGYLSPLRPSERPSALSHSEHRDGNQGAAEQSSGTQYEAEPPVVGATSAPSAGTAASQVDTGPYASKAGNRNVERSAEMVLGAEPADVASDAAAVFDAVHAVDGIVLSSSVRGGAEGEAGASFDLLIPSAKLSDALAAFSAIDTVVTRHEATDDITAPTVRTGEQLRDSRARIDGLLVQLAGADSDEERAAVEAELRAERRHAAALRSEAAKLGRRANLSRVSLRIETGAAATPADENGANWGIDDALGDAGHILAIAAAVTIVGLAIVGPLALIALLAWLANRARVRRGRERALA